jgi:hypothetical protein
MIELIIFGDYKLMPLKPWKILNSNYLRPRYRFDNVELPNGKVFEATALEFRTWAAVLALTKKQEVVLVRQFDTASGCLEFPAAWWRMAKITGWRRRECGRDRLYNFNWLEENDPRPANKSVWLSGIRRRETDVQRFDEAEDIEVHLVPLDGLVAMTKRGEFLSGLRSGRLFHASPI